jgi:hypothetical protein
MHIFVSRNIFQVHLHIIHCTSRILRQQKRTFEQKYSKFDDTTTLNTTFFEHMAELFNHLYDQWPQLSEPSTGKDGYSLYPDTGSVQHESDIYCDT